MDFRKQVMMYSQKHQLISGRDRLLVACSGGADSMALLTFLNQQKDFLGIEIGCIHANHGLRGEESDEDERFVEDLCHNLNISFHRKKLPINDILIRENGNLQDICRRERYHFFEEVMKKSKYNKLAVAHHADDQVESVLMGLTRGTRTNGMLSKRSFGNAKLIRPFLSVTRKQIEHYLKQQHITYREDSSNKKDTYTRNRFRHHIVPLVQEENPNVAAAISQWTHQQQQDEQLLQKLTMNEYEKIILSTSLHSLSIDIQLFQRIEIALQKRVVLLILKYLYPNESLWLSHDLINQIHSQCLERDGSSEIHLPKGRKVFRHYSTMLFSFDEANSSPLLTPIILVTGEWVAAGFNLRIKVCSRDDAFCFDEGWYVTLEQSELPIRMRGRQSGDRLLLKGMTESKRLSRLMIDEKVPRHIREEVPVIETQLGEIIGLPGVRLGSRFTKHPHDGWTHKFMIEKETTKPEEESIC
ncbi:tRNA lysidine(34) synthetase TilS [Paenisporosarcina sp. TG-14]|uniref:tRNA lysidine(34) synthetase TilS n=1 Tax=Paenisporosarcina sp. TG-14 TaxID=1231057 RepID=UPI00030FA203|nr:tRNA lysidine(34) synthetase TilS [Paenisporosarcina sp. TG-14]